ncbi:MAG: VWA domain-containing protein [Lysobacterales bacterium]
MSKSGMGGLLALWLLCSGTAQALELQAADQVGVDSQVSVRIVGSVDPKAFVSIVEPAQPAGEYDRYAYARSAEISVAAPTTPGTYEIRLLGADSPYPTLASRPIEVVMPTASLQAPAEVGVGQKLSVRWSGPSGAQEFLSILPATAEDGSYEHYSYVRGEGSGTVELEAPTTPGDFEIRYMTGSASIVIARQPLRVGDVAASLQAPTEAALGSTISIGWQGTGNRLDFITIVKPDAASGDYGDYAYTRDNPVKLAVPEVAGEYELRYLSADSSRIYARAPLRVGGAAASVDGPVQVEAGSEFAVRWSGPDNDLDYVAVTPVGRPNDYLNYTYTRRGSPLALGAPTEPGDYELHYLTGRSNQSLASRPLKVVPSAQPGSLRVTAGAANASGQPGPAGGASSGERLSIELILDASGSMLQKLSGQRRIDIARQALQSLVRQDIQADTPVALRVFGHRQPNACDTDLLVPLAPLDAAAMGQRIAGIEAKNLAKTPIAASLAAVADDLAGVEGRAIVILVTDGEETCGGNPEAAVQQLRQQGFEVVLNIVGFAVDDYALEQDFRRWASLGGGAYFQAKDAAALSRSIAQAAQQPFSVLDGERPVAAGVLGGEAISLKPGRYTVRALGRSQIVEVQAGTEARVNFD